MPWDAPGTTAIVILTREAEPLVGSFYAQHSSAGRDGMTPHVTLVVPFAPAAAIDERVERRLGDVFRGFERFDYGLRRLEYFESGVLYLAPEPALAFVDIVSRLFEEFPGYPPYEGLHEEIVPHVTVAETGDEGLLERIRANVMPRLPIRCRAEDATLVERGTDLRWRPRASFAFGSLE